MDVWRELIAIGDNADVVLPPGIVVAGYCPCRANSMPRVESGAYAARMESFSKYKALLCLHGATVVTVNAKPDGPVLPNLASGTISIGERERR